MSPSAFLRQQLDRPPLEHGRLCVAACAAACMGYLVYLGGLYAGLPPEDLARDSGFIFLLLHPIVMVFALPIGLGFALFAYGLSLLLPRHALQRAWSLACVGVLVAAALSGWAWGPRSIVLVPAQAIALVALTWLVFPVHAHRAP